ncbi:MAG: biopolymer transporter ExbD [Pseudomonadota bacterium]
MKLAIVRPRKRSELVNITPLIDVVFILLVFFMLAGAIERPDPLDVALPQSESILTDEVEDVVILIDKEGRVAFRDQPMRDDAELIRNATVWFAARPDSSIQLKADGEAEAARVIEVMEALREAGAQSLVLVTVGGGA